MKKKKIIDNLASLASTHTYELDSIIHDASILIDVEQSTLDQNVQLTTSLDGLQNAFLNLRV